MLNRLSLIALATLLGAAPALAKDYLLVPARPDKLVVVDAAGRESRELDELEPRELKELWATAVGAMAAMASTAAVAMWKVFMG